MILRSCACGSASSSSSTRPTAGPQLAAMIAYYALLSFVPLTFLALSLLGFFGRADESSYCVEELDTIFPNSSVSTIAEHVQRHPGELDHDRHRRARLPRSGRRCRSSARSSRPSTSSTGSRTGRSSRASSVRSRCSPGSSSCSSLGLVVGSFGYGELERLVPGLSGNSVVAYALPSIVSSLAVFGFLLSVYYLLTNVEHGIRDVLPGALLATVGARGDVPGAPGLPPSRAKLDCSASLRRAR